MDHGQHHDPAQPESAEHRHPGHAGDTNAEVWKSEEVVRAWAADAEQREQRRREDRAMLADLLPFDEGDAFTFADLGAGTGAGARAVLDRYPNATAVLADFSPQMMNVGAEELAGYEG